VVAISAGECALLVAEQLALGESQPITVDVRVISATNKDLRRRITEGLFREDLLFRLNMFHIHLPPLRDRREDIPELARHLLARHAKRPIENVSHLLTPEALQVLLTHPFTGNVRELSNAMEYAWIISGGGAITPDCLPHEMRNPRGAATIPMAFPANGPASPAPNYGGTGAPATTLPFPAPAAPLGGTTAPPNPTDPNAPTKSLADVEMEYILHVYSKNGMNKQKTSDELGISLKTLYNKLHKYEEERQRRAG
jgi:DNA-binding NtrC family response regulator